MAVMTLRLPDELHEALRKQAAAEHLSANEWTARVLENVLSARTRLRDELIEKIAVEDAEIFARLAEK